MSSGYSKNRASNARISFTPREQVKCSKTVIFFRTLIWINNLYLPVIFCAENIEFDVIKSSKAYIYMKRLNLVRYLCNVTMAKCKNCGSHVSDDFERVFADDEGNVYACPECAANAGIAEVSMSRR